MMRFSLILVCLIPWFLWSQVDTTTFEIDTIQLEPDFVPLKIDGEWKWYDIVNNNASDSIFITDCAYSEFTFSSSFVVKDSSHWGILSSSGDTICAFAYDSIIYIDNQLLTKFNDQWSYHSWNDGRADSLIQVTFDSLYFNGKDIYLFDKGKTGLIRRNRTVIQPKYDGIHEFSCSSGGGYEPFYMSLAGEEYNLLNWEGEEILPKGVWDLRCTEDGVFEFKRGELSEFYSPDLEEFIQPNGRDVIFYNKLGYKIYNDDNTKGELHLSDGRVFKDQYDDYFILGNGYFAVRKDGKIALTTNGIDLLTEFKYDQINLIVEPVFFGDTSQYYFKFYLDDACGLLDQNGNELFDAAYANIFPTSVQSRFIVLDNGLTGIVNDEGKTIIPIQYDKISLNHGTKLFIVIHKERMGLFDLDGKVISPVEYEGYSVLASYSDGEKTEGLIAIKKRKKYYFLNSKGLIDTRGFDHYNFSNDVLKTYDNKYISVFLFDGNGTIEEKANYPIYNNAVVTKNFRDNWRITGDWKVSELEENQKEGYYGLRYFKKKGLGVPPKYRTIRPVSFQDFLGKVDVSNEEYPLTEDVNLKVVNGYHHLMTGSGKTNNAAYFSSELAIFRYGSGNRYVNRTIYGDQSHAYGNGGVPKSIDFSRKIHYSDFADFQNKYRRYFKGGEVKICSIENADVSFYEYFRYLNATDGCRVTPDIMKEILNPTLGVRFVNSDCDVINSGYNDVLSKSQSYPSPQSFDEYYFINAKVFFERQKEASVGTLRLRDLPKENEEEVKVENVIDASIPKSSNGNDRILAKVKQNRLAKVHIDYPNYLLYVDSIDIAYEAGRITRRIDSNTVQLSTPEGKIVVDSCVMIRYLNEERFAVLKEKGWQLIDKNGVLITNDWYSGVSDFVNNRAEFRFADVTAVVINKDGERLKSLPEPRIFLDKDHYHFASSPEKIINRFSQQSDEAKEGEEYVSCGFFVSKKGDKKILRRFGSSKNIEFKSASKLKVFGSCVYYKNGKHVYSVDSNLVVAKHKKVDKFREVTPEIGWLEGKKDQLIDSEWNYIHKMSKNQRFEIREGNLVVLEEDSVFHNFGSLKSKTTVSEVLQQKPEAQVFFEDGKYGARVGNDTILPSEYSWLSKINDQEFMTRIDSELHLYDSNLKRIGNRPFDAFLETDQGNLVFFDDRGVYVILNGVGELKVID